MNDRLGDLPTWAADSDDEDEPTKGGDIEMGEASKQPKHMDHFFREVESIKSDIEAITKATRSIGHINDRALQATTTEEENELSRKLRPLVDQTNKKAKSTKTLLGLLKEETQKLQENKQIKQSDLRYVRSNAKFLTRNESTFSNKAVSLVLIAFVKIFATHWRGNSLTRWRHTRRHSKSIRRTLKRR